MPCDEATVDEAALLVSQRLDVALFFWELHEEHPNPNRLRTDAERLLKRWGIDVSQHLPESQ